MALAERAVRKPSERRATVLDPFRGSASTPIAWTKVRLQARLIELDPQCVGTVILR